jgi:cytochrome c biogenesis protein CcdA
MAQPQQSFEKHTQLVPAYHFVLFFLIVVTLVGAVVNFFSSLDDHSRLYNAALILAISIILVIIFGLVRVFPLKAQDRAIRAEENLRHFALTGKLLDSRLSLSQIIALRFAPDAEFPGLARKAADENMPMKEIKRSIRNWKGDYNRL